MLVSSSNTGRFFLEEGSFLGWVLFPPWPWKSPGLSPYVPSQSSPLPGGLIQLLIIYTLYMPKTPHFLNLFPCPRPSSFISLVAWNLHFEVSMSLSTNRPKTKFCIQPPKQISTPVFSLSIITTLFTCACRSLKVTLLLNDRPSKCIWKLTTSHQVQCYIPGPRHCQVYAIVS